MVANAGHTGAISSLASDGCEEVLPLRALTPGRLEAEGGKLGHRHHPARRGPDAGAGI